MTNENKTVSRRATLKTLAWSTPVIALAVAAPAASASSQQPSGPAHLTLSMGPMDSTPGALTITAGSENIPHWTTLSIGFETAQGSALSVANGQVTSSPAGTFNVWKSDNRIWLQTYHDIAPGQSVSLTVSPGVSRVSRYDLRLEFPSVAQHHATAMAKPAELVNGWRVHYESINVVHYPNYQV